jgi:aspartyl-tRNA synthetase
MKIFVPIGNPSLHRYLLLNFALIFKCSYIQIDLEMAFTDGEGVMNRVENLIKSVYARFAKPGTPIEKPLPGSSFLRMSYDEAMSNHGSDKPDLRIQPLVSNF